MMHAWHLGISGDMTTPTWQPVTPIIILPRNKSSILW